MTERFQANLEKRVANLRLRAFGLALVFVGLVIARWFIDYRIEVVLWTALFFVVELTTIWYLLKRLEKIPNEPRSMLLLNLAGQLQVVVELLLLTWAVYYTGGITSPLVPLYFIYIFADGLTLSVRTLAVHTLFVFLLVFFVTVGTFSGLLPHFNAGLVQETEFWSDPGYVAGALVVYGSIFLLTLLVAFTFNQRTRQRERELAKSENELTLRVDQVTTMREIGQQIASSLELDKVLDTVGESAMKLVKATDVHIFPYDEEQERFSPGIGVWADGHRGTVVSTPRPDGLSARVATTKLPIIVNDAETHPLYQSLQARVWALKAIAGFPLIKSDRVVGVMNVAFLEPHQITRQEEEALLALTDQAAIAIENARLYQEVQRKIQELSALNAVTQSAANLTDIRVMLNDALGAVLAAIHADAAIVGTLEGQKQSLELAAHRGLSAVALSEFKSRPLRVGEGFAGTVIETGKPHFASEMGKSPRAVRSNLEPFTSIYTVPLRAYDHMIGVLQLLWKEQHQLTPNEVNLAGAIAPQLAAAVYNSTLFEATKRRAEELATLRSIGLATTSTLNLREQLRLLYENVNQLLKADTFFVGLYDETRDELRVEHIVEEGWFLRPLQVPLTQAGLSGWVVKHQKSYLARDLQLSENVPTAPVHITRPARSWLGVPLQLKERVVGLISAQSFQPNAFTVEDERFLTAVAQHVALALDNARLFGESERRTRELTLLNEISRSISASLDLDVVQEHAAHALADQLGYKHVGIYEFDGSQLVCRASVADQTPGEVWDVSRGVIGRVARTGRAAFVTNVAADPDYVAMHDDIVSEICVPIVREGRVLGLVNIEESRVGALKDDDVTLLMVLSEQLAIASQNALMYRQALARERFATRLGQLGLTVSSTLDVPQLVEIMCRESLLLFGVDTAAIYLREPLRDTQRPETRVVGAGYEIAPGFEQWSLVCRAAAGEGRDGILGTAIPIDQLGNILVRTLRLARGAILHDAKMSPTLPPELINAAHPAACLVVPIIRERDVLGVLVMCDAFDSQRFAESDQMRAGIVASQAALAISNARLLQEAQKRAKEQSSLYEIGLAVSSTLDLSQQLRIIYEQVAKHFKLSGFDIALVDEDNILKFAMFIDQGQQLEPFTRPVSDAGLAGWVVSSRRTLVIDDIARQWDTLPVKPGEHGEKRETASYIGIPLMTKAEATGVMALQRSPVEPFTADEQRFLFALAQQVAFAVDNARLHEIAQRSAAQQKLLYQASRRIAGALDLDALLSGIVEALEHDFDYEGVLVMLVDPPGNELRPAASSTALAGKVTASYRQEIGAGLIGLAAESGVTQVSNNTTEDERFLTIGNWLPLSEVAVPIKSSGSVIGVLDVQSLAQDTFSQEDVRMFEAIADQLAVAIENANLFTHARERLERLNALQTIELAIVSSLELVNRLDMILEHAVGQLRADIGVIYLKDKETKELYGLRQRGSRDLQAFRLLRLKPGEGAAGWILERGEPLFIADVRHDDRWRHSAAIDSEGIVSYLGVPLQVEDDTIGVLDVSTRHQHLFTGEEINFFNTLASHAAVAIENARLYEQTRAQLELLRDTQERLVETERRAAIGELIAGLAHEINNPLTAIVGHSQLLMETMPSGPATEAWREELDTISGAAQRIARIVQEFVQLSHVEGGHDELVNLTDVLRAAMDKFQAREDSQDIAISETMPGDPLWVRANPQLLEQVVTNVLTNAMEAMPKGGGIEVHAGMADKDRVYCSVRDSGHGIAPQELKRVFEPGYTTKVEGGVVRGIGLGLYTAERIILGHGGAIWLESEVGRFTIATFTLPRARMEGE